MALIWILDAELDRPLCNVPPLRSRRQPDRRSPTYSIPLRDAPVSTREPITRRGSVTSHDVAREQEAP